MHRSLAIVAILLAIPTVGCAGDMGIETQQKGLSDTCQKVERARYCTSRFLGICTNSTSPSHLAFWEEAGVSNDNQKKLYLSVWSDPNGTSRYSTLPKAKHLVLIMAGQQTGSGKDNGLTGQYAGYENGCDGDTAYCYKYFDGDSLAKRVYSGGYFPLSETFFAVVLNAQFNHTMSSSNKQETINGYINWLKNNVDFANLKSVYLAGSSRGGCLALRLAKQLKANHGLATVPFVVQGFDPVCKKSQGELGTYDSQVDNPVASAPSNYRGWKSYLPNEFASKNSLAIRNLVGGDEVTWANINITGVHALTYTYATSINTKLYNSVGDVWFEQQWVNLTHAQIGTNAASYSTTVLNPMLDHLQFALDRFHCPDGVEWSDSLGRCAVTCAAGQVVSADGQCVTVSDTCDYVWYGTSHENNCSTSWNGTSDGCDCGCQFTDPDCGPVGTWTGWYDRDNASGSGDYEGYVDQGSPCPAGTSLVDTESACVSGTCDDDVLTHYSTGGIACVNASQAGTASNYCGDWKVRFLCN